MAPTVRTETRTTTYTSRNYAPDDFGDMGFVSAHSVSSRNQALDSVTVSSDSFCQSVAWHYVIYSPIIVILQVGVANYSFSSCVLVESSIQ